jgi:hypothetical protein
LHCLKSPFLIRQKTIEKEKKRRKRKAKEGENGASDPADHPPAKETKLATSDSSAETETAADSGTSDCADASAAAETVADPGTRNGAAIPVNSGGHRAGYDAFMTGFAFVTFLVHQTQLPRNPASFLPDSIRAERLANRSGFARKYRLFLIKF